LAGLDEDRPSATTGWRRPRLVSVEGDDLVFEWWPDQVFLASDWSARQNGPPAWLRWRDQRGYLMTLGSPDVYPSRKLLTTFAQLADAPTERIRQFAGRHGALQEQVREVSDWSPPPLLPDRQPLGYWRLMSRLFARALDLAALPTRTSTQDNQLLQLVNGHLFQAGVVDFLTFQGGHPRVLHSAGGLYGGLAVELLSATARVGLRLCEACGLEVEPGGRRFCRSCRDLGVPARLRQERFRAAHKTSKANKTGGRT
jgi:hypothetical protein